MQYSAKRGLAIACHLSVHLSVRLSATSVDQQHISWKSWKLIVWTISLTFSFFVAHIHILPGEHEEILGRQCSFNTYVHNVRLNWVNRESRDLRWRCGCLFTFVGASRSHLCDSNELLFCPLDRIACTHCIDAITHQIAKISLKSFNWTLTLNSETIFYESEAGNMLRFVHTGWDAVRCGALPSRRRMTPQRGRCVWTFRLTPKRSERNGDGLQPYVSRIIRYFPCIV